MTAAAAPIAKVDVARIAHEANRAYCQSLGDHSQAEWALAEEWQRSGILEGVLNIATGIVKTPEESHAMWLAHKKADGWQYGETKDAANKRHPCMVEYDALPAAQRVKDALFFAIVTTLIDIRPPKNEVTSPE